MVLVGLLLTVIVAAVAGSLHAARSTNWTPFAPHGWAAVGGAASVLMLSFVGWEAVAPLTRRLTNPARSLPRVTAVAFAVTTVVYLALACAVVAVLGPHADGPVPVADLLRVAVGAAGPTIAAGRQRYVYAGSTASAHAFATRPVAGRGRLELRGIGRGARS